MADVKEWTEDDIITLLDNRQDAVERAVLAIYKRQTAGEQITGHTIEANGVGFSAYDDKSGTYYAEYILKGRHLSGIYIDRARKLIKKYRRQLTEIANESGKKKELKNVSM